MCGALGPLARDVVRVADAFLTRQGARHSADYDDTYDLSRATVLTLVDTARGAVDTSYRLAANDDHAYQLFLRLMLSAAQAKTKELLRHGEDQGAEPDRRDGR